MASLLFQLPAFGPEQTFGQAIVADESAPTTAAEGMELVRDHPCARWLIQKPAAVVTYTVTLWRWSATFSEWFLDGLPEVYTGSAMIRQNAGAPLFAQISGFGTDGTGFKKLLQGYVFGV